jgi:hypothetical protein
MLIALMGGCATTEAPPAAPPPRAEPTGPTDQLDKNQVVAGMSAVKGAVVQCYRGRKPGVYFADVIIDGSGRISRVNVRGADLATDDCVGQAVAGAVFPPFTGPPMLVSYPYLLR